MTPFSRTCVTSAVALATIGTLAAPAAQARTAAQITAQGRQTLAQLEQSEPRARRLAAQAQGILVFPAIYKAGLLIGGESGNGVLFVKGRPTRFYNLSGGTWGLQAGAQKFSYVLLFMNETALHYLHKSDGWAVGTGPSVVVVDKGGSAEASSTTLAHDVYAFPFNGKGLMADLTLQGTKISPIHPR